MALTLANIGDTFLVSMLNQVINVLQMPSGGQELGKYKIEGNSTTTTATQSCPILTRSRNATPISLSIDTADQAVSSLNAPSTDHLTQGGARILATVNAASGQPDEHCAGNWTMQY